MAGGAHMSTHSARERFMAKVRQSAGCWDWIAKTNRSGYGQFWDGTHYPNGSPRFVLAHRFSYELFVGPIPDGLQIDHLCRNRGCVRPEHLEPVTRSVNLLRSPLMGRANREKTCCSMGHPFDDGNTRHEYTANGWHKRHCRECHNAQERARRSRIAREGDAS